MSLCKWIVKNVLNEYYHGSIIAKLSIARLNQNCVSILELFHT
jgi:hypothetical protein